METLEVELGLEEPGAGGGEGGGIGGVEVEGVVLCGVEAVDVVDVTSFRSWAGDLQSPESIGLHELDDLLGDGFE